MIYTIVSISAIGVVAAIALYFVAKQFKVVEDPRIDIVEALTPGANCGGCGYPGCRGFAESIVKRESLDGFYCPVGGNDCMKQIAEALGLEAEEQEPQVAVLRCSGSLANCKKTNIYDGAGSCAIEHSLYAGDTGCQYGCMGHGDCVDVCGFDALYIDKETGLPVVLSENCTACGNCVEQCPRNLFELRPRGKKDRRVWVSCMNQDKGAQTKKACDAGCIGCQKCVKVCKFDAITVENFLAYIDPEKCKLCRKCTEPGLCPTNAIHEINFPARKAKKEEVDGVKTVEPTGIKPATVIEGNGETDQDKPFKEAAPKKEEPKEEKAE